VPPRESSRLIATPFAQMSIVREVPAFAGGTSFTVTVAVASAQGAAPVTVYTYGPGSIVAGSYAPPATALGPLQVPPAAGVPPRESSRLIATPFAQMSMVREVPALTGACSFTVTVAVAFAQGLVPVTVYTYGPGSIVAGSYAPPATGLGPLQVPPTAGVPPKESSRLIATPFAQMSMEREVPALGAATSVTVTVAVASAQPPPPGTVYTKTPGAWL